MVLGGVAGPSVRSSIAAARSAAQAVRPSLPSELYEQVNALHWRVQEPAWRPDLFPFLGDVQLSIKLVDGLLEDTMSHEEARDFVRLGKFVERTGNVTALVTRKSAELGDEEPSRGRGAASEVVGLSPEDTLEWSAVLKSCFAFESYQARYSGGVTPERVIECLLLDATLPRSARFSAGVALDSVSRIDGPGRRSRPRRILSHLNELFAAGGTVWLGKQARELDVQCRTSLRQLEVAMRETYFHPSKVPTTVMGEEGRAMPQQ
jgi:uncharacterized alpha-E superfamily protein